MTISHTPVFGVTRPHVVPDMSTTDDERQLRRDAHRIAWIGACNPQAVRRTLEAHEKTFGADHVAVRAIRGHLNFLEGRSLGPTFAELDAVREMPR